MTLFGLNSPIILIILIIILYFLGPKRIEKGYHLFLKLLKFLLSDENQNSEVLKAAAEKAAAEKAAAEKATAKKSAADVKLKKSQKNIEVKSKEDKND